MGILMLAILAFLGLTNIHRMNGIKNIAATIINGVTIIFFVAYSFVRPDMVHIDWPVAAAMVIGACIGGYGLHGIAQKLPVAVVRAIVIIIGLVGAVFTAYKTWFWEYACHPSLQLFPMWHLPHGLTYLDQFRGYTVFGMIVVNYLGDFRQAFIRSFIITIPTAAMPTRSCRSSSLRSALRCDSRW